MGVRGYEGGERIEVEGVKGLYKGRGKSVVNG